MQCNNVFTIAEHFVPIACNTLFRTLVTHCFKLLKHFETGSKYKFHIEKQKRGYGQKTSKYEIICSIKTAIIV